MTSPAPPLPTSTTATDVTAAGLCDASLVQGLVLEVAPAGYRAMVETYPALVRSSGCTRPSPQGHSGAPRLRLRLRLLVQDSACCEPLAAPGVIRKAGRRPVVPGEPGPRPPGFADLLCVGWESPAAVTDGCAPGVVRVTVHLPLGVLMSLSTFARPSGRTAVVAGTTAAAVVLSGGLALAHGKGGGGGQRPPQGQVVHSESVVVTSTGYVTRLAQYGVVQTVSANSLSVLSGDGYSRTYALTSSTVYRAGKSQASNASLAAGDTVAVDATLAGGTATATKVDERTPKPTATSSPSATATSS